VGLATTLLRSPLAAALASPHRVDHYLQQIDPMWAVEDVRARVVDIRREVDGDHPVATLTLQPTRTWRGHRAGQHVQVGLEVGGRRTTRVFSLSSAASAPGEDVTITVRANPDGVVSRHLVEEVPLGTVLHLSQAQGVFTLEESPASPRNSHLVMISGGSGITPVMSMVRTLLRDGYDGHAGRRVTFLHYARTPEDQIFADELAAIAAADNGVDVHLVHDEAGGEPFSAAALERLVPGFRDLDTWACGPAGLMDLVQEAYGEENPRLRREWFKLGATASGTAEGEVTFAASGTAAANTGATLLEQAEAAGLTPQFGCRMGICFSCTSRKTSGTVRDVLTGVESALPDEEVRICVSQPVGDCTVEL
jgi:ferredoxin-NADP reductase